MEKFPNSGEISINKLDLIEILKNNPESQASKDALKKFMDEEYRRIRKGEIDKLDYQITMAEIYRESDLLKKAIDSYYKAIDFAVEEGRREIILMCESEIDRLKDLLL